MPLHLEEYAFRIAENSLRLGEFIGDADWNLDVKGGLLSFVHPRSGDTLVRCPAQIVGSESDANGTFLWAWANTASGLPDTVLQAVNHLRETAETENADPAFQTAEPFPLPHPSFSSEAAYLCAGVADGCAVYRCPYDGGAAHVVVMTCPELDTLPADSLRAIRAITSCISVFELDHQAALHAYAGEPDKNGVYAAKGVRVTFDEQGRIANMEATLPSATQLRTVSTPDAHRTAIPAQTGAALPPRKSFLDRLLGR